MKAEEAIFHIDLVQSGTTGGELHDRGVGRLHRAEQRHPRQARRRRDRHRPRRAPLRRRPHDAGDVGRRHRRRQRPGGRVLRRDQRPATARPRPSSATPTPFDERRGRRGVDRITVTGVVDVLAKLDGDLWAFTVAGAFSTPGTCRTDPAGGNTREGGVAARPNAPRRPPASGRPPPWPSTSCTTRCRHRSPMRDSSGRAASR